MKNINVRKMMASVKANNATEPKEEIKIYTVRFIKAKTPNAVTDILKTRFSNDPYFEILESFDSTIITGGSHVWEQFYKARTGVLVSPDISGGALEILFAGMVKDVSTRVIK